MKPSLDCTFTFAPCSTSVRQSWWLPTSAAVWITLIPPGEHAFTSAPALMSSRKASMIRSRLTGSGSVRASCSSEVWPCGPRASTGVRSRLGLSSACAEPSPAESEGAAWLDIDPLASAASSNVRSVNRDSMSSSSVAASASALALLLK